MSTFSKFTNIIQKYTNITELDEIILNELIEKIIIHECEYIDWKRVQKIDIYYRFVGIILKNLALNCKIFLRILLKLKIWYNECIKNDV